MFAVQLDAVTSTQWDFYFKRLDYEPPIFKVDETYPSRVEFWDLAVLHTSSDKIVVKNKEEVTVVFKDGTRITIA